MPAPASPSDPRRVLRLVWAERGAYLPGLFFVAVGIGTALFYEPMILKTLNAGIEEYLGHAADERNGVVAMTPLFAVGR